MAVLIWDVVLDEVINDPTLQSISRNDGIWKALLLCAFDDAWSTHPIWQTSTHIPPIDSKTVFLRYGFLNELSSDCFLCKFLHNPQNYIYEFGDFASFGIFSEYFSIPFLLHLSLDFAWLSLTEHFSTQMTHWTCPGITQYARACAHLG